MWSLGASIETKIDMKGRMIKSSVTKNVFALIAISALIGYVTLLLSQTVFCRSSQYNYSHYLMPFWSYQAILDGYYLIIIDILLNLAMFIPVGLLLRLGIKSINCRGVLLVCLFVSVSIEFLQFALNRGSAEFDDVMHNLLGGLFGYELYYLIKSGYEKFLNRRMAVL